MITVIFDVPGMTQEQYDQCLPQLEAAGEGTPPGRLYHVASPTPNGWSVVDVWDSQESFDKFGQTMVPIIEGLGVNLTEPKIYSTHNIIKGETAAV